MEGDAGTGRLNPIDTDDSLTIQEKNEDSTAAESGAEQTGPKDASEDLVESAADADHGESGEPPGAATRGPSRVGRGWLAAIAAVLVLCAGGIGAGGYLALRSHHESQAIARTDAAAVKTAVDCVAAALAPDTATLATSVQKILDCSTGGFRSQAMLNSPRLIQAYQAANVHMQLSDARAAVERRNNDGSLDVLVAMRTKTSGDQPAEFGYRMRVTMVLEEGQYKISKLDQVTK